MTNSVSQLSGNPGTVTEISSEFIKNRLTTNNPHNMAKGDNKEQ